MTRKIYFRKKMFKRHGHFCDFTLNIPGYLSAFHRSQVSRIGARAIAAQGLLARDSAQTRKSQNPFAILLVFAGQSGGRAV